MANPIQMFIDIAMSHKDEDGTFAYSLSGLSAPYAFCAAFIVSCGRKLEQQIGLPIIGNIIFFSWGALDITRYSSSLNGSFISNPGTWINGIMLGNIAVPSPGDIILYKYPSNYHVGIVRGVANGKVYTIEGNVTHIATGRAHMCDTRERDLGDSTIYAYCRPNWSVVGGSYSGVNSVLMNSQNASNVIYATQVKPSTQPTDTTQTPTIITPKTATPKDVVKDTVQDLEPIEPATLISKSLYQTASTREDAILREVCYIDNSGNKTLSKTGIKLSVINYTSALSMLVRNEDSSEYYFDGNRLDTDLLTDSREKVVCRYLLDKGFNAPQMVGILSVIWKISEFQSDFVDKSKQRYGIMGWNKSDIEKVIRSCGKTWQNNITGQLDYWWIDVTLNHKDFISKMENEVVKNEKQYIKKSVEIMLDEFYPGYTKAILESCSLKGYNEYEKMLVEDEK